MFATVMLAILPVVLLIALGKGLQRSGFLAQSFWGQAERLSYFVLLPALFVQSLSSADLGTLPVKAMVLTLFFALTGMAAVTLALRRVIGGAPETFTSVFQGAIRFNNFIGMTIVTGMFGAEGLTVAALCNAVIVPTVNVLCILVFARFGTATPTVRGILKQIYTNPLVISCAIGLGLQAVRVDLPQALDLALRSLGTSALPLGLLCVGAALEFGALKRGMRPTFWAVGLKLIGMPILTLLLAKTFGLEGQTLFMLLLFQGLPTATSSFILARQLGGDAPVMAGIIAVQTVLTAVILPVMLAFLAPFTGL